MLQNSNRTSVFEHLSWEPKRARWSRNALRTRSCGNEKPSKAEMHSTDRFLIKEKRKAMWSRNALRTRSRGNEEPSGAEMHSTDRFLIKTDRFLIKKRKATAQPDSP